jgi:hypothetical protein
MSCTLIIRFRVLWRDECLGGAVASALRSCVLFDVRASAPEVLQALKREISYGFLKQAYEGLLHPKAVFQKSGEGTD